MNQKQRLFCKYYAKTNDIILASKNAGYTEKTARNLLKKDEIKKYIENILENKKIAKSNEIIECLTKIMREENDIKERLKAAELLGKVYCIFSQKQEDIKQTPIIILGSEDIEE